MQEIKGDPSSHILLVRVMAVHCGTTITLAMVVCAIFTFLGHGENSFLLLLASPIMGFMNGSMRYWYLKRLNKVDSAARFSKD